MAKFSVPRLLIGGASARAGKTLVTMGLVYELRRRGMSVSVCMTNSNLTLAVLYRRMSGRYVRCVDPNLLSAAQILDALEQASLGADIVIIDGAGAFYDGASPGLFNGSDAEVATVARCPVALVFDSRFGGTSLGAACKGFSHYAQGFEFGACIVNRIYDNEDAKRDVRDRTYYGTVMQTLRLPILAGAVPEFGFEFSELPKKFSERTNQSAVPRQFFVDVHSGVAPALDVNVLLDLASRAPALEVAHNPAASARQCRIAVADDVCFGLCFQDNLDLLRYHGADLVSFSPLADKKLPEGIGGIYISGGYLDEYGVDLAANTRLLGEIKDFAERGGNIYAEGGGTPYLCESFRIESESQPLNGAGVIRGVGATQEESVSYCDAAMIEDSVFTSAGSLMKGATTGRWKFAQDFPVMKTLQVGRPYQRAVVEGFSPRDNLFASFCFWHWGSSPEIARRFIESAALFCPPSKD